MLEKGPFFVGLSNGKRLPNTLDALRKHYTDLAAAYRMRGMVTQAEIFTEMAEEFTEMAEHFEKEVLPEISVRKE